MSDLQEALMAGVAHVVAQLPFLPRGKGALILIQGGLVVLGFSLLWSLMSPRGTPVHLGSRAPALGRAAGTRAPEGLEEVAFTAAQRGKSLRKGPLAAQQPALFQAPPRPDVHAFTRSLPTKPALARSTHDAPQTAEGWVDSPLEAMMRPHVGRTRLLSANASWFILTVTACRSCRHHVKGPSGCDAERTAIEKAVRPTAPHARITEVSCNLLGHGGCTFKVERGRAT